MGINCSSQKTFKAKSQMIQQQQKDKIENLEDYVENETFDKEFQPKYTYQYQIIPRFLTNIQQTWIQEQENTQLNTCCEEPIALKGDQKYDKMKQKQGKLNMQKLKQTLNEEKRNSLEFKFKSKVPNFNIKDKIKKENSKSPLKYQNKNNQKKQVKQHQKQNIFLNKKRENY